MKKQAQQVDVLIQFIAWLIKPKYTIILINNDMHAYMLESAKFLLVKLAGGKLNVYQIICSLMVVKAHIS
jgi:hypothetical protein